MRSAADTLIYLTASIFICFRDGHRHEFVPRVVCWVKLTAGPLQSAAMEPAPKSAAVTCALPPGGSSDQAGHDPATVKVQDAVQAPPGLPDTEGDVGHANLVEASKVGEGVAADVQHVVEVLETSPAEQVTVSPVPCGVYLVAGVMALSMLGNEMLYTVLPSIHSQAGVPVEAIGLIFSMNRFTRLLSNTGASWVVDKFGRRWPLIYASCAAIFVTAGYGIIYGVWMFLAFRVMWGIIYSFVRQEAITTAVDLATPSTKGRVMGTYQSIARLGVLVGMLLGGFLTDFMGYRKSFIVFGLITCAAPVLAIVEMSARQQDGAARLPAEMVAAAAEGVEQAELVECDAEQNDEENPPAQDTPKPTPNEQDSGPRGGAVRKYEVVMTFVGAFCFRLVVDGMFTSVLGYMLLERYGENPVLLRAPLISLPVASLNGALLSTLGFVEMVVAPYAGNLGDKLGRHKVRFEHGRCVVCPVSHFASKLTLCCFCS